MDDFTVSGLHESKNEWAARLLTILTPHLIEGIRSILDESVKLCRENDEMDKYLMTFQNLIARIPKWSSEIVKTETARIIEKSGCAYLEDLITCIHIIQLKILTAVRVGQKQKKVDLNVMDINTFIHTCYINTARQVYRNVYLFDRNTTPLSTQKNNREVELIVQECILSTIRDSIPVETILKCYMDETTEEDITEEIKEEDITPEPVPEPVTETVVEPVKEPVVETVVTPAEEPDTIDNSDVSSTVLSSPSIIDTSSNPQSAGGVTLKFNDIDNAVDVDKNVFQIDAPKNIEHLQQISDARHSAKLIGDDDDDDDDYDSGKLVISNNNVKLDDMDIQTIEEPRINILPPLIDDIEVLT